MPTEKPTRYNTPITVPAPQSGDEAELLRKLGPRWGRHAPLPVVRTPGDES